MIELVDFYANWCGPCQVMKPIFDELEKDYVGKVEFKKVDVEQEIDFSAKYGVSGIPTYIILKDGKEVSRKVGAMPKETLRAWINANL